MADARSTLVLDSTGAPLTTATPSFVDYRDRAGSARTPPAAPSHLGGGVWAFTPSDADETAGTVALVDFGAGAEPRRVTWGLHLPDGSNQFWAVHIEDEAGALWTGAAPTAGVYDDSAGSPRTPPSLAVVSGAYLFALTPTSADVAAGIEGRLDGPAGSNQPYWAFSSVPLVEGGGAPLPLAPSVGVQPTRLAASALRDYLLRYLPAKVTQLNALRGAVLKSPAVGPWNISSGSLALATAREGAVTTVTLPTGAAVTAAQVVTAINAAPVPGLTASADGDGRLVLTAAAPTEGVQSVARVTAGASNALFGWPQEGAYETTTALTAPTHKGVLDGWPVSLPDMGRTFAVIIGDRDAVPLGGVRRDEHTVTLDVAVWVADRAAGGHRSRETLESCARAVHELLTSDDGRTLGRARVGDVIHTDVTRMRIKGMPFQAFDESKRPVGGPTEVASLTVTVKVFHRPSITP
jgi:hypothetical protein